MDTKLLEKVLFSMSPDDVIETISNSDYVDVEEQDSNRKKWSFTKMAQGDQKICGM